MNYELGIRKWGLLAASICGCFFVFGPSLAADPADWRSIKVFDGQTLQQNSEFLPFDSSYSGEYSISAVDLGGDKTYEILVGSGSGNIGKVKIFRQDGSLINEFLPYNEKFIGGIRLASADLDNDGQDEIITAPGHWGGPHVRVFDGFGQPKVNSGFMAFEENYRQGIKINAGFLISKSEKSILVSRVYDRPEAEIKFFDSQGGDLKKSFKIKDKYKNSLDLNLAVCDLGGDGIEEIIINGGYGSDSKIEIRRMDGSLISSFDAFENVFSGGVNLATGDIDGDGKNEIIAGAGIGHSPQVKIFDSYGNLEKEFLAADEGFKGGVKVILGKINGVVALIAAPDRLLYSTVGGGKQIKVDVGKKQTLYLYQDGFLIKDYLISSGINTLKTPLGQFSIYRKRPDVHMKGVGYDLPHVPWVMSFRGPYTTHGTYWHSNFGHPMSHGCVNMYTPDAKWLYDLIPVGTPVEIYKGA